jgi:glycosyltransferase involved in cell wall biosynthesis
MPERTIGWVAASGDSFVQPILAHLARQYRIVPVTDWPDPAVDLLWCDWCDEALVEITSKPRTCPLIARLHSYEAFAESGDLLRRIDWSKVDALVFVAEHVRRHVRKHHQIAGPTLHTIRHGIDLDRFSPPPERSRGRKVGWVGTVTSKKGPQLFVQAAAALRRRDPAFEFHVVGAIAEERVEAYVEHLLALLDLAGSVHLHGAVPSEEIPDLLRGMDYILSTSPWESTQLSVAQAVACGCIPLIHHWPGADEVYPHLRDGLWRTVDELVERVGELTFREEYRAGLRPLADQLAETGRLVDGILSPPASASSPKLAMPLWGPCEHPVVSASMIVRNEAEGIERCLRSIRDLVDEVVIVDTGSTDGTDDIASRLGARVHREPWQADFALHRNHALDLCRGRWIVVIDGDEELVEIGDLREYLAHPTGDGALVTVHSMGVAGPVETSMGVRVFDRTRARWKYPVHNQLVGIEQVVATSAVLQARYSDDVWANTRERLVVLLEHAQRAPEELHYRYFIAKSYRVLGEVENLALWSRRYLDLDRESPRAAQVFVWLAEACSAMKQEERAEQALGEGLARHPGYPDLHYLALTLAAGRWYSTATRLDPAYLTVSATSRDHVSGFEQAVRLLDLPIRITT